MHTTPDAAMSTYHRDLGNSLVLRWSIADDTEKIALLVGQVFRSKADEPPNTHLQNLVRRFMRGDHPLMGAGDYAVIEDTSKDDRPIVACTCLLRHTWQYEGIPISIGRPEIVASDAAYRNRGLVRALFEMIHARSEAEGHMVQAITGIPYFYRQFGYEYALDLGGRRTTYLSLIPKAKEETPEPYTLREATAEDIPQIMAFYSQRRAGSIVWNAPSETYWRYELEAWKTFPEQDRQSVLHMIVDTSGTVRGYVFTSAKRWRGFGVWALDLAPGVNMQAVLPPILRALQAYGAQVPTENSDTEAFSELAFFLGRQHPVYEVLGQGLAPYVEPPYAWYIRVVNVPALLQHIAPVLERRLAQSSVVGYTGEIKLDFYRGGLQMAFDQGKLTSASHWLVPLFEGNASGGFPPLVFLQLLFGYRNLDELRYAFPDIWVSNEGEVVLKALFPSRPSWVMP